MREFERAAAALGAAADQIPFIMSFALNKAALDARRAIVEQTWPKSITQRNPTFIRAALRTRFASKHDLSVEVYDYLDRGQLKRHAEGGTKIPKGKQLAIPSRNVKRGSRGVPKGQRPRSLPPNKTVVKKGRIYQVVGKGKSRQLKVMYFLKQQARVPKDVPFYNDFNAAIRKGMYDNLPKAVVKAMSTRR